MALSSPSRPPTLAASALRIFDLSLGQMLWSRRSVFLAVLVGGPVALAVAIRIAALLNIGPPRGPRPGGPVLFGLMIWLLYIRFIVPVLGVFYGTALIADEVDDKTITYLFIRPIHRASVLLGKYLAYLACTTLIVLPSVVLVYFLIVPMRGGSIGAGFPSLLADLAMMVVGLACYGAVFALVGARLKRPLVMGLVFAFGWEPGVLLFPGYLKRLSVAYYLQALVPHAMPNEAAASILLRVVSEVPRVSVALVSLALISVGALWLAARAVGTREYVLEQ
jgi:ABC-type transport system involved in multi-copper enzyme maturation permease subunit